MSSRRPATRPSPLVEPWSWPTCRLDFDGGSIVAVLDGHGDPRTMRSEVSRHQVRALVEGHLANLAGGGGRSQPALWESPTEEYLAAVYRTVARPLVDLVSRAGRVVLSFGDPLLARLPIEVAHDDLGPALFELLPIHRLLPAPVAAGPDAAGRRCFALDLRRGAEEGLAAVALERLLVASAHHRVQAPPAARERVIHIAGHEPDLNGLVLREDESAHVVLSGCSSTPGRLVAGVASVTCSLWPVDDESSAALMAAFHARLASGVGPAEALRQAQLLHRQLPSSAWAAYVHAGRPH